MVFSGEVAHIHMRTDVKNLVTAARTIHLREQKETIHMISMLRKEACSGSIHDLAHIPSQNRFADCLTKASAKANNLITAVKTGRLLDVDTHPGFTTLVQGFLTYLIQNIHAHKGQGCSLLDCPKKSLAPTPQERPFQVKFARTQHTEEQMELNMCELKRQDATNITSAFADSCIDDDFGKTVVSVLGSCDIFALCRAPFLVAL